MAGETPGSAAAAQSVGNILSRRAEPAWPARHRRSRRDSSGGSDLIRHRHLSTLGRHDGDPDRPFATELPELPEELVLAFHFDERFAADFLLRGNDVSRLQAHQVVELDA